MSDFSQQIRDKYTQLTKIQRHIADYLLEHNNDLAFTKLDELSLNINVSTTSIIRFARALGYRGYSDMQESFQKKYVNNTSLPQRLDSAIGATKQDQLLLDVFQNDIDNIHATLTMLSETDLAEAVHSIIAAENVYILGTRGTFSVAHYLGYRLSQSMKNVRLADGMGMMYPEQVSSITPNDVCISFMFPRYTKITAQLLSWIKHRGAKIILFTKLGNTEVNSYGDILLPCQVKGVSYKNSLSSLFCICNYILAAVVVQDYDNASQSINRTEELIQGFFLGTD